MIYTGEWADDVFKAWELLSWKGRAQWFASKLEGSRKRVLGGVLESSDQLLGTIRNAEALKWDLYLQANPFARSARSKLQRDDITHWRYVVVDLDPVMKLPPFPPTPAWPEACARVFSGRGYQFWIPLRDIPEIKDAPRVERLMHGYLHWLSRSGAYEPYWRVDTTCSDLARVVRCPGSVNQKTGQRATVDYYTTTGDLVPETLEPYITSGPEIAEPLVNSSNLLGVLAHLNGRNRKFLLDGVDEPGRHTALYGTAKTLQELGVPVEVAVDWLRVGAFKCRGPLPWGDVRRVIRQVFGKDVK